jgi:hypothetical protein
MGMKVCKIRSRFAPARRPTNSSIGKRSSTSTYCLPKDGGIELMAGIPAAGGHAASNAGASTMVSSPVQLVGDGRRSLSSSARRSLGATPRAASTVGLASVACTGPSRSRPIAYAAATWQA